jgi:hypothetical protein
LTSCSPGNKLGSVLKQVGRLPVRLDDANGYRDRGRRLLGRKRYEHKNEDDPAGYRNGHQSPVAAVKTAIGPVDLSCPKIRDTDDALARSCSGPG